jgi:hypothetical protein
MGGEMTPFRPRWHNLDDSMGRRRLSLLARFGIVKIFVREAYPA